MPRVRGHYRRGPFFRTVWVRSHYRRPQGATALLVVLVAVLVLGFLILALT